MTTLHTVALITAVPGHEQAVHDALTTLVGHTRDEDGCVRYDLFESAAAPGTFVTVEEWTDQAALDGHLGSEHVRAALAAADGLLAEPPAIHPLTPA